MIPQGRGQGARRSRMVSSVADSQNKTYCNVVSFEVEETRIREEEAARIVAHYQSCSSEV